MKLSRSYSWAVAVLATVLCAGAIFAGTSAPGAVYTMTNSPAGNSVLAFQRSADGTLAGAGSFSTGGTGTGAGLGNQGALALGNNRWLLVVNAGSDSVSVFRVEEDGRLSLADVQPSGGDMPVSITVDRSLVYVLNAGAPNNIAGFTLDAAGHLTPLPGSTRPLSAASSSPAQVQFSPDGNVLVVTEKATNKIVTYTVGSDGLASGPIVHNSVGATPFGFAFGLRDQLFVSEAFGGAADASAVSSYSVSAAGALQVISGSVPTTETAACWVVVTNDGRFVYTTNTGSGSISGYAAASDGVIQLLSADGRTGVTGAGSGPIDMALSRNSRYGYVLNSGNQTISAFAVGADGSLAPIQTLGGLPAGLNGLAAY